MKKKKDVRKDKKLTITKERVRDLTVSTDLHAGLFKCAACPPSCTMTKD
jgi:hypothetical protein